MYLKKRLSAGFETREEMLSAVDKAYSKAAQTVAFDGIIPAFEVMKRLYDEVGEDTYRDGFHASLGIGRYALGCVWFETLFGKDVSGNTFCDFDVPMSDGQIAIAKKAAKEALAELKLNIK